jgi:hypothetical protein
LLGAWQARISLAGIGQSFRRQVTRVLREWMAVRHTSGIRGWDAPSMILITLRWILNTVRAGLRQATTISALVETLDWAFRCRGLPRLSNSGPIRATLNGLCEVLGTSRRRRAPATPTALAALATLASGPTQAAALAHLILHVPWRVTDFCGMRWSDLSLVEGSLKVVCQSYKTTRRGFRRVLGLPLACLLPPHPFLVPGPSILPIFPSIDETWETLRLAVPGLGRYGARVALLRHLGGSLSIPQIAQISGHKRQRTLDGYLGDSLRPAHKVVRRTIVPRTGH